MSGKHTPGPWTVHVGLGLPPAVARFDEASGDVEPVADLIPFPREDIKPGRTLANAHLVAAAPAMLDFIEMVRDASSDAISDGIQGEWCSETVKRCDAMLAQARGEETRP